MFRKQKRDVMQNFWRDKICCFESTRPLIGCPQYLPPILAPDTCPRYLGPIRGLVHSKRQIVSLQKFRLTSLFGNIKTFLKLRLRANPALLYFPVDILFCIAIKRNYLCSVTLTLYIHEASTTDMLYMKD